MRIDVKKFLFVGVQKDRNDFFRRAQQLGLIHFIKDTKEQPHLPGVIENITRAIKVLRHQQPAPQEDLEDVTLAEGIAQQIVELDNALKALHDQRRILNLEIARVAPFGDFSMEDIRYIENETHRVIQFYCAHHGFAEENPLPDHMIYVTSDENLDYFMALNPEPRQYERMIEMQIDKPLDVLRQEYDEGNSRIHDIEEHLKTYTRFNDFLHHALISYMNKYNLHAAESDVDQLMDNSLFTIEGWVPVDKVEDVQQSLIGSNVYFEEVAIEEQDTIPTYLENQGMHRVGEDLVHIYDTPSATDKDPSLWVLFFFSLFFAFIIGDGGYGLIFFLIAGWIQYKVPKMRSAGRRFMKLFFTLSVACIVWGVLTSNFFGIDIPLDTPLRKLSVMDWLAEKRADWHLMHKDELYQEWVKKFPAIAQAQNGTEMINAAVTTKDGVKHYELLAKMADNILMELALVIGIVHISLGFLRYLDKNWSGIGWVIFMIGCYLYLPYYLGTTSLLHYVFGVSQKDYATNGIYLIEGGFILAMTLAVIQHKLFGLLESMHVIQIFADVLSYLRLYALGLAGAIVTATINEFAAMAPFVLGVVLLIFGHAINMGLAVMGGVIHGLRLNFLEWYHYSFEGGGKRFNPLRLLTLD